MQNKVSGSARPCENLLSFEKKIHVAECCHYHHATRAPIPRVESMVSCPAKRPYKSLTFVQENESFKQLQLFSYCKYSSRIVMNLRQNKHIGICNSAAMEKPFRKAKAPEFEAEHVIELKAAIPSLEHEQLLNSLLY